MNNNLIFSDPKLREEFMDRFPDLAAEAPRGLESLDAMRFSTQDAEKAVKSMQEGTGEPVDSGLEAIIRRFGRPAYFVQNDTFDTVGTRSSSEQVDNTVNTAKALIDAAIPSVGRINLRNHRMPWVGTGWVVAPNVLVTNRHVASEFATKEGDGFVFIETAGRQAKAELDTIREHDNSGEKVYRLREVLWIEPASGHDVAFLSIDPESSDDDPQPAVIDLLDEEAFNATPVEHWAAVIGYPAFSIFNDAQDQQRIFDGVFNIKRMQPGKIVAKGTNGIVNHDATTLGGNSGSVVLDLTTGKALALHFGGIEGDTNSAVAGPKVSELLREHVS